MCRIISPYALTSERAQLYSAALLEHDLILVKLSARIEMTCIDLVSHRFDPVKIQTLAALGTWTN